MSSPEYAASIRVNSLGFRGGPIRDDKRRPVRVLFLGDSFTFGHGLPEEDTLPALVGAELDRKEPGAFEVVNGGVYGYSTGHELNFLEKFGVGIEPDIVVTVMLVDDMVENLAVYRLTINGTLEKLQIASTFNQSRQVTQFIPGASWLRGHSHLFKFVGVRVLPVLRSGIAPVVNADSDETAAELKARARAENYVKPEFYAERGGPFEVTTALLSQLAATAAAHGARSILLTLGGDYEISNGRLAPDVMIPHERLRDVAVRSGFSRVVALPPLLAKCAESRRLFFPLDGHWNAAGTKCVTPAVADAILQTLSQSSGRADSGGLQ
jgi:hypothetical protein